MQHVISSAVHRATNDVGCLLLKLKKNFSRVWKDLEQSCVIHPITYDSDHS